MIRKILICVLIVMSLQLHPTALGASPVSPRSSSSLPPCPIEYVCFTPAQVIAMDKAVIELNKAIALADAKMKRFGACAGAGGGYSLRENLEFEPSIGAYIIYGLRLPF